MNKPPLKESNVVIPLTLLKIAIKHIFPNVVWNEHNTCNQLLPNFILVQRSIVLYFGDHLVPVVDQIL
jgi:hypothetical protein